MTRHRPVQKVRSRADSGPIARIAAKNLIAALAAQGDRDFAAGKLRNQIIRPCSAVAERLIEKSRYSLQCPGKVRLRRRHFQMRGAKMRSDAARRIRLGSSGRLE